MSPSGGHRESHLGPHTPREPGRQPPGDFGEALRLGPEADLALGAAGTDADPVLFWLELDLIGSKSSKWCRPCWTQDGTAQGFLADDCN